MDLDQSEARFASYVAGLGSVLGHAERTRPLRDYCTGLMLPGERKKRLDQRRPDRSRRDSR